MPQDPKDVVRSFFATLSTGEFGKIAEFFTEDSTWTVNDVTNGFPSQRGRAIVDDFLQPVREGLFAPGDPKVEIIRLIAEGNTVAAETIGRGALLNGNTYENHYAFVLEVDPEAGKVLALKEYMDSDYAHSISAPTEAGAPDAKYAEQLKSLGHEV
jgi:ketosteroid isomerase-like protein